MTSRPPAPLGSRLFRWAKTLLKLVVLLAVAAAVALFLAVRHYEKDLPDVHGLRASYKPPQVTRVLARDGSVLAEVFLERRTVISIKTLPPHVKLAVLAAEDASFYEHEGINYLGIVRAMLVNVRSGRVRQGASTITQQVVKNVLLDAERSLKRKVREALLARRLEQELSKDEILELYLNHIYFGGGRYGIEEAARYYFGKSAKDMTFGEAAMIGAVIAGPEIYSPRHDPKKALVRRDLVLGQMEAKGFLSPSQAAAARQEAVELSVLVETQSSLAPEVVEIARRTLREIVGEEAVKGGFVIHTTVDPRLQGLARRAVRENLLALDKRTKVLGPLLKPPEPKVVKGKKIPVTAGEKPFEGTPRASDAHKTLLGVVTARHDDKNTLEVSVGTVKGIVKLADFERYNPAKLSASDFAQEGAQVRVSFLGALPDPAKVDPPPVPLRLELGAESALVALDPRTREVLALIGSYEGAAGALDRATQIKRQPGSTFKPVLYSYALHSRKVTPATLVDASTPPQATYKNVNLEDVAAAQKLRLREGLAKSVNPVAVQVMKDVGPENVVAWGKSLGITSKLGADLSLALGAYEVSPIEMAGAYGTFAAGGTYQTPLLVTKIVGPDGKERALPPREEPRRVLDDAEAYLMTSMLTSVITSGTGAKAREIGRPAAGKTGTTNQSKDAWFIGYTPDVVCAVWTGYDEPKPLGGGREAGSTAALPAWIAFMKGAHEKRPPTDFSRPVGLSVVKIDPESGLRAYDGQENAIDELFLAGTEPTETAQPAAPPEPTETAAGAGGAPAATGSPPSEQPAPAPVPAVSSLPMLP